MDKGLSNFENDYLPDNATNCVREKSDVAQSSAPVWSFLEDGNQYVLDCLTSTDAMSTIAGQWRQLEENSHEPYIYFQSFDWCHEWCRTYAENENSPVEIKIYLLRRNGELVMVWPMMVINPHLGIRVLTFLTEPHGQYGNILCDTSLVSLNIGRRVWQHINDTCDADAITLDQYPSSSFLSKIVEGKGELEKSSRHASVLDLNAFTSWDEYHASLSRSQRKQRKRRRNKIAKLGELDFEVFYGGSARYRELVDLALQWKKTWLHETARRATVLSRTSTKNFLNSLPGHKGTGSQGKAGAPPRGAMLGVLTLDGKPIGIEIGMCLDAHYYSYLGAFDWQCRNLSPGKIQIEEAQIWAKNAGLGKFDFLGDPADYKTAWTNTTDALESRAIAVSARGFLYCYVWKSRLRPLARKIFNKASVNSRAKLLGFLRLRASDKKSEPSRINVATIDMPSLDGEEPRLNNKCK